MAQVRLSRDQVAPGCGTVVEADGKKIALFNVDGTYYAMDNVCQHSGGPLGEGSLDGTTVSCPWHGWEYDVTSGACQLDETVKVATFPVQVDGEQLVIDVP
jgi:nitrite reductase (NADH) small subunit